MFGGSMGCLLFNSSTAYTWDNAYEYCYKQGGKLVEIRSAQQMEFLTNSLKQLETYGTKHHWWTAGTDFGHEGRWIWSSSLSNVDSYVWHSGDPNGGMTQNCLLLDSGFSYKGNDWDCAKSYMPICRRF